MRSETGCTSPKRQFDFGGSLSPLPNIKKTHRIPQNKLLERNPLWEEWSHDPTPSPNSTKNYLSKSLQAALLHLFFCLERFQQVNPPWRKEPTCFFLFYKLMRRRFDRSMLIIYCNPWWKREEWLIIMKCEWHHWHAFSLNNYML